MDIPHNAHILVLDGARMRLFHNGGTLMEPKLDLVLQRERDSAATHEQGVERSGTNFESSGSRRSSYEQTDFHQMDEDRFAVEAADMLGSEVMAGHIDALLVVAAPRALGELRKHLHEDVAGRVVGEMAMDVTGLSIPDMAAALIAK